MISHPLQATSSVSAGNPNHRPCCLRSSRSSQPTHGWILEGAHGMAEDAVNATGNRARPLGPPHKGCQTGGAFGDRSARRRKELRNPGLRRAGPSWFPEERSVPGRSPRRVGGCLLSASPYAIAAPCTSVSSFYEDAGRVRLRHLRARTDLVTFSLKLTFEVLELRTPTWHFTGTKFQATAVTVGNREDVCVLNAFDMQRRRGRASTEHGTSLSFSLPPLRSR